MFTVKKQMKISKITNGEYHLNIEKRGTLNEDDTIQIVDHVKKVTGSKVIVYIDIIGISEITFKAFSVLYDLVKECNKNLMHIYFSNVSSGIEEKMNILTSTL